MLDVGITEIVRGVCVIGLYCKSGFHVLHVRYVLVVKLLQVVFMC